MTYLKQSDNGKSLRFLEIAGGNRRDIPTAEDWRRYAEETRKLRERGLPPELYEREIKKITEELRI